MKKESEISELRRFLQQERELQKEIESTLYETKTKINMTKLNVENTDKMISNEKEKIHQELQEINDF